MAARTWFTADNTDGLDSGDLAILNRAARLLDDLGYKATNVNLMAARMTYRPGMSAADLADRTQGLLDARGD